MRSSVLIRWLAVAAAVLTLQVGHAARAADLEPAAAQVDAFDKALLDTMKDGKTLGMAGRIRKLAPAIDRAFDLAKMTRFSVGPSWTTMSASDQKALIDAFSRMSIATWAHNFASYGGERFQTNPVVDTRGPDKVVQTQLIPSSGAPINFAYRMQQSGGTWKIVDVYFGAISQLTTRRSDFAAPLAAGGAPELVKHLNALTDKLMK